LLLKIVRSFFSFNLIDSLLLYFNLKDFLLVLGCVNRMVELEEELLHLFKLDLLLVQLDLELVDIFPVLLLLGVKHHEVAS